MLSLLVKQMVEIPVEKQPSRYDRNYQKEYYERNKEKINKALKIKRDALKEKQHE